MGLRLQVGFDPRGDSHLRDAVLSLEPLGPRSCPSVVITTLHPRVLPRLLVSRRLVHATVRSVVSGWLGGLSLSPVYPAWLAIAAVASAQWCFRRSCHSTPFPVGPLFLSTGFLSR